MSKPTIVVIGASPNRSRFANKAIRAYIAAGYSVYPVTNKQGDIEGLPSYKSISDVPITKPDRVAMYVGPANGIGLLDEIAEKGCGELWLNPGTHDEALIAKADSLGLESIVGCAIVDLGVSPSAFPDE